MGTSPALILPAMPILVAAAAGAREDLCLACWGGAASLSKALSPAPQITAPVLLLQQSRAGPNWHHPHLPPILAVSSEISEPLLTLAVTENRRIRRLSRTSTTAGRSKHRPATDETRTGCVHLYQLGGMDAASPLPRLESVQVAERRRKSSLLTCTH